MNKRIWMVLLAAALLLLAVPAMAGEGGSWAQISEDLSRPEGWRPIVTDSGFALGEQRQIGTVDGEAIYEQEYGTYPSIDGSTVCVPMALEFARQMLPLDEADLQGFVFFSTTHGAYEHLIGKTPHGGSFLVEQNAALNAAHPVDLVIATEPSDEELAMAEAAGITLVKKPVCYDAFVFITHVDNPVDSLTVEQIRGIYSGEIVQWHQAGGPEDDPAWIRAYVREPNSGSQTAMENMVMQGTPIGDDLRFDISDEMSQLVRRVGEYRASETSIGYTYLYYIENLYPSENIKVLAIDGILPTDEAVRDGSYPFSTHYYGVIRGGEEEAVGGKFLDWMLSAEGQACIAQAGYIPMTEIGGGGQ